MKNHTELDKILIKTDRGIVTKKDIEICAKEYIDMLPDPDFVVKKSETFTGMVQYIYDEIIKPLEPKRDTGVDYIFFDCVFWRYYIPMCSMYGYTPILLVFCSICRLDYRCIQYIIKGINTNYIGSIYRVNIDKRDIVKKWSDICEGRTLDKALNGNGIGAIFALKSVYGYQEQQRIVIGSPEDLAPRLSVQELAAIADGDIVPDT